MTMALFILNHGIGKSQNQLSSLLMTNWPSWALLVNSYYWWRPSLNIRNKNGQNAQWWWSVIMVFWLVRNPTVRIIRIFWTSNLLRHSLMYRNVQGAGTIWEKSWFAQSFDGVSIWNCFPVWDTITDPTQKQVSHLLLSAKVRMVSDNG